MGSSAATRRDYCLRGDGRAQKLRKASGTPSLVNLFTATSAVGPGCVKTRLSQGRAELFSQLPSPNRSCQCNRFSTTTKTRRCQREVRFAPRNRHFTAACREGLFHIAAGRMQLRLHVEGTLGDTCDCDWLFWLCSFSQAMPMPKSDSLGSLQGSLRPHRDSGGRHAADCGLAQRTWPGAIRAALCRERH